MGEYNSLIPAVANAAIALSSEISGLVARTKARGQIQRAQLQMLENQTRKVIADAQAHHAAELVMENLEQIARTQEKIDDLERRGHLHGPSLMMAMTQLDDLNNILRQNLRHYYHI